MVAFEDPFAFIFDQHIYLAVFTNPHLMDNVAKLGREIEKANHSQPKLRLNMDTRLTWA